MAAFVKIVVFTPVSHSEKIRRVLGELGCGHVGKYNCCSFSAKGVGRFKPRKNANPFIGKKGIKKKVVEERIETVCPKSKIKKVLAAVKKAHPYEEPAVDIYPLLNKGQL